MRATTVKTPKGDGLDDDTRERSANEAPSLLHEAISQMQATAERDARERHERMLERRLERRRTVVRWLMHYPPIALQGARPLTEHRGSMDDAPCPSS